MASVAVLNFNIKPVAGHTDLLVDPGFDDSVNSTDLRNNSPWQDWYESRGSFSTGDSTLLSLDTSDVGGNKGKKAALKNFGVSRNAYLTQEFSSPQIGTFNVTFDIYIDRIQDNGDYDRVGHIYIGDDRYTVDAPTGRSDERFVLLAFYDPTPGETGTDIQIRARTTASQSWSITSQWLQVATGLSYKTWYTIKIVVKVASGVYDVYVNGELKKANITKYSGYTPTSVIYITFSADSDGRGDFYVDNVFSPDPETRIKVVSKVSEVLVGQEFAVYINVTDVADLYGWEFQFNYNPSILDLTHSVIISGGLNEPINIFMSLIDEENGRLWWAVSTRYPTTAGIAYLDRAIFGMRFKAIAAGATSLDLSGTVLVDSNGNSIQHKVVNGSVSVQTLDLIVEAIEITNKHAKETWLGSIYANDTWWDGETPYYYPVNVTIKNTGTKPATNFKVKLEVYYETSLEAWGEITVGNLPGSSSLELTFANVFHPTKTGDIGKYVLKAIVDSGNVVMETDETNNMLEKKDFMVTIMGDVNGDKTVNILDAVKIALAWNGKPSDPQWNIYADLNHDDEININDGIRIGLNWGKRW
ncbi:MAG: dockerin type I domain-containing protein [Candidatus Bathyarchaeota archaeon]|nr:dockerin type I domain-containing protein [Candidatus Bathyarchaeota archaeon]